MRADRALRRRRADDEGGRGGARRDLPQRRADGEWKEGNRNRRFFHFPDAQQEQPRIWLIRGHIAIRNSGQKLLRYSKMGEI